MNGPKRITDLNLAAALVAQDFPLTGVEGPPHRRIFLIDAAEHAIFDFYAGRDAISSRKLLDALRNLKGLAVQTF
jgi:hypothetical protein